MERANRLFTALPEKDRRRILARCDRVELRATEILHEAGRRQSHVYFPTQGSISLITPVGIRAGLEVALVGSEGMVGISFLLSVSVCPLHHRVRDAGHALRMTATSLLTELERSPALRRRLNRYAYVKMHQIAQTAACVHFHSTEERLAKMLLMKQDRSPSNKFHATHEHLADMLGVRRESVTQAANLMQKELLIRYRRGEMTVLDRPGLEASSCECYRLAGKLYARILN